MKLSEVVRGFAKDQESIDRVQHWRNTLEDIQNNCQTEADRNACAGLLDQIRAGSGEQEATAS